MLSVASNSSGSRLARQASAIRERRRCGSWLLWASGGMRAGLVVAGCVGLLSCRTGAEAVRINAHVPGPERWHIKCKQEYLACEREAKKICEDYIEVSRHASGPEPKRVTDSTMSSTAPTHGLPHWEGNLIIQCGEDVPPLRLVRAPEDETGAPSGQSAGGAPATGARTTGAPSAAAGSRSDPTSATPNASVGGARGIGAGACVPGETQACLGPGACRGAQFCLKNASGYSPCDCGGSEPPQAPAVGGETPKADPAP